jgi:hypothetical protein
MGLCLSGALAGARGRVTLACALARLSQPARVRVPAVDLVVLVLPDLLAVALRHHPSCRGEKALAASESAKNS